MVKIKSGDVGFRYLISGGGKFQKLYSKFKAVFRKGIVMLVRVIFAQSTLYLLGLRRTVLLKESIGLVHTEFFG